MMRRTGSTPPPVYSILLASKLRDRALQQEQFFFQGFLKTHPTLSALITHHSVMQELLPVPLNLQRYNPFYPSQHPEYQPLKDIVRLLAEPRGIIHVDPS